MPYDLASSSASEAAFSDVRIFTPSNTCVAGMMSTWADKMFSGFNF